MHALIHLKVGISEHTEVPGQWEAKKESWTNSPALTMTPAATTAVKGSCATLTGKTGREERVIWPE